MTDSNNKTSYLVSSQVPQFVADEHPKFIQFLEKYYEFLEQEGQLLDIGKNLNNYLDIDLADATFQEKIYNQFLKLLSVNVITDKTTLIKYIKDFYRAKGTENAVRFLARILFKKEIEFYYPKTDILRASDGKWFVERSLRVTDVAVNNVSNTIALLNFKNHTIRGASSNATAKVETIDVYYDKGDIVSELKLSGIRREFESEENIFAYFTEEGVDKRISANIYSGIITGVRVLKKGTGYIEGTTVPLISATGRNGDIKVNRVTAGSLKAIGVTYGGAGYEANDEILVTTSFGGGGIGASGQVVSVDLTEQYHPNTYQFVGTTISSEENTILSNVVFSNLNSSNIYTTIANAMQYWTYANCGPILTAGVTNSGEGYNILPNLSVRGNTYIRSLGVIGRVGVVAGGLNYSIGDSVEFVNPPGGYGTGAHAEVTDIAANGAIREVKIVAIPGHTAGGSGYSRIKKPVPVANSLTGYGATLISEAFLASDDQLQPLTDDIGAIEELIIISGGTGYLEPPILDLSTHGDGTAEANATVARVLYVYPGRYLNDDGHISGYNFLENKDYYQNYSYVVKIDESLNKYRTALNNLTHPLGLKMFGEYTFTNDIVINKELEVTDTATTLFLEGNYQIFYKDATYNVNTLNVTYTPLTFMATYRANNQYKNDTYFANNSNVSIFSPRHGFSNSDYVYVSFVTNATANLVGGIYSVTRANTNYFTVVTQNTHNNITGSSYSWDPRIVIQNRSNSSFDIMSPGKNVYVVFGVVDPYLTEQKYTVFSANSTHFTVIDENIPDIFEDSGNVNVWTSHITINTTNHKFNVGDKSYITFRTGDMANATNGYTTVYKANANTMVLSLKEPIFTNGNASIVTKDVTVYSANNAQSDNANVQIWFTSGDIANTVNGVYMIDYIDGNTFNITLNQITIVSGNASLYTNNSIFNVTLKDHGYNDGDRIYMEYVSGDLYSIANGIFKVENVSDIDTFSVYRSDLVITKANGVGSLTATANTFRVSTALYQTVG